MAKSSSKARTRKTKPDAPGAPPASGDNSKNLTSDEKRALFLSHRKTWAEWKAKQAVVDQFESDMKSALKNDGFTVKQMKIADDLADVKGEAKIKGEVSDRLLVARWIGHPLGAQMDLFERPDDTPAAERAYDQGKQCSMENKPAKPPYDPSTEQFHEYMRGYHDHQRELAGGIRAPESATAH